MYIHIVLSLSFKDASIGKGLSVSYTFYRHQNWSKTELVKRKYRLYVSYKLTFKYYKQWLHFRLLIHITTSIITTLLKVYVILFEGCCA